MNVAGKARAYFQRISGTKNEDRNVVVSKKSVKSVACWTTSGSKSSSSNPNMCQVSNIGRHCSIISEGSYDMLDAEDLSASGYALPAMFDSFNILKVKVSSRNNSVDDYLMVTDTDSSAREPVEEEDSRDFINRQNIVSSLDALPCTLASAQDLDEAFHLDSPSTSLACAIPTLKSSVISASQVTSRTNDFLSQDVRELWLTREPFMETTAGVASGGGEVRDSKVCPSDGVSKGEEILDSCSIGCSHDRGLSDTLTESVQNTSDFEQTFSASDNAPLQSFPLNTGALPPADMTSVNAPLQSSPLPADMTSVNAPLQSSPLNTGALPPADMTSVNAPLQSSPLNTGALPPAHTTDSDEALSKKTRKLDALQCPKLKADIKQGSCRRNMSDPCPKPMIYIKLKAFSDVRSISEPNEKDLVASEMLKLVERPDRWSLQSTPSSLSKHHQMSEIRLPTEHSIRKCIENNCSEFLDYTNWKCLLPHLMSNQLLDKDTCECLMNNFSTNLDKGLHFYFLVLPSKGSTAYSRFYDSIAQEQEHIGHKTLLEKIDDFSLHL